MHCEQPNQVEIGRNTHHGRRYQTPNSVQAPGAVRQYSGYLEKTYFYRLQHSYRSISGVYKPTNDCNHSFSSLAFPTPLTTMSLDPFTPFNPMNPDIPCQDNEIFVNETMQPPFKDWIKRKLDDIFTGEDFDTAFDDLISDQVGDLTFRGEKQCCRKHFKQKLLNEVTSHKGEVQTVDILQAPSGGDNELVCDPS